MNVADIQPSEQVGVVECFKNRELMLTPVKISITANERRHNPTITTQGTA